ncbi:helix-turn-helix transcriptional regulator [Aquimarina sp. SS2-1]|uniref:helix-turn-helix transcriptional regulator n=1 Tax=Aquimarina besae TaxID=3342247 RepID=UPI00366E1376
MYVTLELYVTAIVCLITAFVIQRIYHKEKIKNQPSISIQGIKWFGLAIFLWGFGALIHLVLVELVEIKSTHKVVIYLGVFISLANSLSILLSLPSIEHQKERNIVVRLVQRFSEKEFVILFSGVLLMISFVFVVSSYSNTEISNNFIWLIDIPISLIVAFALLNELNKAFANRNMKFMVFPCFMLFVLIVIAVTHRMIPQDKALEYIDQNFWSLFGVITGLSFKFLFILLFSILLYSWKFLSEKELKQTELEMLAKEKEELLNKQEKLLLANESHLDTISSLQKRLKESDLKIRSLMESTKIELSDRQKEVLGNLGVCGAHKSYTEIAEEMNISLDGFQTHIYQIKKVLKISGAGGKEQLIEFAKANQLLKYASIINKDAD